jgi:hypothetical protein
VPGVSYFGGQGSLERRLQALRAGLATGVPLSVGAGVERCFLVSSQSARCARAGDVDAVSLRAIGKSRAVAPRSGAIGLLPGRLKAVKRAAVMRLGRAADVFPSFATHTETETAIASHLSS